jgi:hypothetical protein
MSWTTEFVTAFSTVGCAIGIGFLMQSGEVAQLRYGSGQIAATSTVPLVGKPPVPVTVSDLTDATELTGVDVEAITLTSARLPISDTIAANYRAVVEVSAPDGIFEKLAEHERSMSEECRVKAQATPTAAAMVKLKLDAPCQGNERITISHEGVVFAETLSDEGHLEILVPALTEAAEFTGSFLNGESVTVSAQVDSVPLYDRVILQWQGYSGVQIHAREFGADYGEEGHVWAGAPRDLSAVAGGRGGFLTSLGDSSVSLPMLTEIYTFPAALSDTDGAVALTIETEVTEANCGSEVQARTYQFSGGKKVASQHLSLAVPNCSAVGNFLVLNNLLQDLTVASKTN